MAGGEASSTLPSLVSSKFRHSSDVGFMHVVEEASRTSPNSKFTIGNMEPYLRKSGQSPVPFKKDSGWETPRNGKESFTFDWSRNINKGRDTQRPNSRKAHKEYGHGRSISQPAAATPRLPTARWHGDSLMTPTKVDAVSRCDDVSEMVVDITSRDPSPLTKMLPLKWPSVVSLHGRSPICRRRSRRNSLTKERSKTKFPQINENTEPARCVPSFPGQQDIKKQDPVTDFYYMAKNMWSQDNPRKPAESRKPVRPGTPKSPVRFRSPRNSISKAHDGKSLLRDITFAAEALCLETEQMTLNWKAESPSEHFEQGHEKQDCKGK